MSNPYLETGVLSEDKTTVIITPINLALAKNFTTMLSYANEWKFFSMSVSGMMFIPNYRVPYMDGYYDNNVVSYNFKISPGFKLAKTTNVSVRYSYASRTADLMSIYEPSHDLSIDFS